MIFSSLINYKLYRNHDHPVWRAKSAVSAALVRQFTEKEMKKRRQDENAKDASSIPRRGRGRPRNRTQEDMERPGPMQEETNGENDA